MRFIDIVLRLIVIGAALTKSLGTITDYRMGYNTNVDRGEKAERIVLTRAYC